MTVTSPTPGVFATDFAAVPGVVDGRNDPLPQRKVVNHYFTGVDVPLSAGRTACPSGPRLSRSLSSRERSARHSDWRSQSRREALLKAAARIARSKTDRRRRSVKCYGARSSRVSHRTPLPGGILAGAHRLHSDGGDGRQRIRGLSSRDTWSTNPIRIPARWLRTAIWTTKISSTCTRWLIPACIPRPTRPEPPPTGHTIWCLRRGRTMARIRASIAA